MASPRGGRLPSQPHRVARREVAGGEPGDPEGDEQGHAGPAPTRRPNPTAARPGPHRDRRPYPRPEAFPPLGDQHRQDQRGQEGPAAGRQRDGPLDQQGRRRQPDARETDPDPPPPGDRAGDVAGAEGGPRRGLGRVEVRPQEGQQLVGRGPHAPAPASAGRSQLAVGFPMASWPGASGTSDPPTGRSRCRSGPGVGGFARPAARHKADRPAARARGPEDRRPGSNRPPPSRAGTRRLPCSGTRTAASPDSRGTGSSGPSRWPTGCPAAAAGPRCARQGGPA